MGHVGSFPLGERGSKRVQEGKRLPRPPCGWPKVGRVRNEFEGSRSDCQQTFWVVPSEPKRRVAPMHPGAVEISCGKCLACLIVKRNQHIGRMMAEHAVSVASVMVTLTYAPGPDGVDPEGAREIRPEDWVAFRKAMRKRHGQGQYCGAGELGELKGRVHWHVGLFFGEACRPPSWIEVPSQVEREYLRALRAGDISLDGRFLCCGVQCARQVSRKTGRAEFISWLPEWPHGYVHIRVVDSGTAGYIAKYIMKPEKAAMLRGPNSPHNSRATYVVRSQRLGYQYMRNLGARAAREGLELTTRYRLRGQEFAYGPRAGKSREFTMTRGMKRELTDAYLRTVAELLARGEVKSWRSKGEIAEGFVVADRLEADVLRDPRHSAERFFAQVAKDKRGQARLPYFDLGAVSRAVSSPDGGVVVKTSRGEYVFTWPDLSGHGRDVRIPLETRRELFLAVRRGGVKALGLFASKREVEAAERIRDRGKGRRVAGAREFAPLVFPLSQTLEHGGVGLATDADRQAAADATARARAAWEASGRVGRRPKRVRLHWKLRQAWASEPQVEGLRRRIVGALMARWCPPASRLACGVRAVGLPSSFAGVSLSAEDRERYPLFAKWFLEAVADAPPF